MAEAHTGRGSSGILPDMVMVASAPPYGEGMGTEYVMTDPADEEELAPRDECSSGDAGGTPFPDAVAGSDGAAAAAADAAPGAVLVAFAAATSASI